MSCLGIGFFWIGAFWEMAAFYGRLIFFGFGKEYHYGLFCLHGCKTEIDMDFYIGPEQENKVLLTYLRQNLSLSRACITALKKAEDGILLNGRHVTVRAVLAEGDVLSLKLEDSAEQEESGIVPRHLPFEVLYEDQDVLAANKPANMPTHPSHGHYEDTLANAAAWYFQEKHQPFVFRAVNRLDRDTSGIVLLAKNRRAAALLAQGMQEHLFQKQYTAVLFGRLPQDSGQIRLPIRRKLPSIIEREVCAPGEGADAFTQYEVLQRVGRLTLAAAFPKTGRTHQLRVHFSAIGFPIAGDTLYGTPQSAACAPRQALHCSFLSFPHPAGGTVSVTAPLPEDIRRLLSAEEELCQHA